MTISGKDVFRAGEIENFTNVFHVTNPDQIICHMEPFVNLEIELTITKGRGYVPADENTTKDLPIGVYGGGVPILTPTSWWVVNNPADDYAVILDLDNIDYANC